jgi:hypothetical protein
MEPVLTDLHATRPDRDGKKATIGVPVACRGFQTEQRESQTWRPAIKLNYLIAKVT